MPGSGTSSSSKVALCPAPQELPARSIESEGTVPAVTVASVKAASPVDHAHALDRRGALA